MFHKAVAEEQAAWHARLARMEAQRHQAHGRHWGRSFFHTLTQTPQATARAATRSACPWDGGVMTDGSGNHFFSFTQLGVLRSAGLPTNMFNPDGTLWRSSLLGGMRYILLHVETDGNTCNTCEIQESSTPAAPLGIQEGTAPAAFDIDLFVCVGGTALKAVECANLVAEPYEALTTQKEDPECAGDPFVHHYSWRIRASNAEDL
jgi:hypothetical protein